MARVSNLLRLEMDDNNLGNGDADLEFLSSLVNCTSLERLDISGNNFQGVLPESISNLSTKLKVISLGRNQLRGNIPIGIGYLINLFVLSFEGNLLTGPIPRSICEPSKLYNLFINHNQLSGSIPSCLGNLTMLSRLDLMSNNLYGGIPESLGQCRNLLSVVLSQNNLSGSIPQEVINSSAQVLDLDLSNNQLSGHIPPGIRALYTFNLSENRLSGEIPESLGQFTGLISLHLTGNIFQGTIPDSFRKLGQIRDLDLSRNKFSGTIPSYLLSFLFLQSLDLSFNDLKGEVPTEGVFWNTSAVSLLGNTRLCGGVPQLKLPKCRSYESESRKWKSESHLLKATDGFSCRNLIGAGSSGSVYWGVLDQQEERIVAVKVLHPQRSSSSRSFAVECEVLKSIRHRNLVKLVSACSSIDFQGNEFKALVFEFMLDGNLDEWLHQLDHTVVGAPIVQVHLNLIQRVNIAIDIASALDYLHNYFHIPIVHCDLKPSNVLLEKDMTACVDFGLASFLPNISCPMLSLDCPSNTITGSIGYVAPEYGMGSAVSTYGDVYSYGILLLEMLTGKRPTDDMFTDGLNLHNFVLMALPEHVKEICDPMLLQGQESTRNDVRNETKRVEECLISIARIGVACSMHSCEARMKIGKVVAELRVIRDVLTGTRIPAEGLSLQ